MFVCVCGDVHIRRLQLQCLGANRAIVGFFGANFILFPAFSFTIRLVLLSSFFFLFLFASFCFFFVSIFFSIWDLRAQTGCRQPSKPPNHYRAFQKSIFVFSFSFFFLCSSPFFLIPLFPVLWRSSEEMVPCQLYLVDSSRRVFRPVKGFHDLTICLKQTFIT